MRMRVDPVKVLESLGVDDYRISRDKKEVHLNHKGFLRVAEFFEQELKGAVIGFEKAGWWWLEERRGRKND